MRRTYNEPPRRERKLNTAIANDQLIYLPKEMIGFGVPNRPGLMMNRAVPVPDIACGPPFFYYENVSMAPKGVWAKISSHLYDIVPEFVDSKHFCAAARKRGYIHNLPIHNRFQIQPPPHNTIQEALPLTVYLNQHPHLHSQLPHLLFGFKNVSLSMETVRPFLFPNQQFSSLELDCGRLGSY